MIEDPATEITERIDQTLVMDPVVRRCAQVVMIVNKTTTEELLLPYLLVLL